MTTSQKTPLSQGNQALRSGQYAQAIQHFCQALITTPSLGKIIVSNIERARNKYQTSRQGADKQHVAVCGSNLSHHATGRVHTLATLYQTFADVEIIGSIFPQWGSEIWEPIRHTAIAKHTFVAEDESRFVEQAIQLVAAHPYDIVHLSKPRAPNIIFGMLYKLIWNAKVLMDMDTHELAQEQTTSLCVDEYIAQSSQFPSLSDLHGQDWTRIAENLATLFDGVTVANTPLQLRYGGSIIRHARDEKRFTPTPDQKRSSKVKHGIAPDKKVVLFFGTACNPQGLLMAAKAIATLQRADLLLVIAGDSPDPTTQAELQAMAGVHVIPIQPIETAPDIVAMADVCLLLQDTARPAAQYQTPAKLSDALAMRIPVIGTPTQALMDVVMTGAILPANTDTLAQQLAQVLDDPQTAHRLSTAGGAYFQKELSFAANQPRLQQATQAHPKPLPEALAGIHPLLSALFPLHHTPPAPHPITPLTPKIAVVAHAYYPELWPEITDRLKAIQHPFDLYITTTPEHAHWVTPTLHGFAHAHITVLPNLGMDVLPFLSLVPTLIEKGYTAVCKLHTKKGTPEQGEPWRRATLDGMIGSEQDFANTAQAFAQHPTLQLAGPAMLYQSVRHLMLGNEAALQDLYMHTQNHPMPDVDWGFFAGNVFWARPALFAPLHQQMAYLQTHITPNYQADGQYIHAIERLTGMLPAAQGGHIGLLHPHANAVQRIAPCTQMGQATMGALTRQYTQLPEDLKRLNDSGLFDEVHYLTQNPSLSGLNINLPTHYLLIGRFNGQTPHPDFDTTYYAQRHAAHIKNQDPFVHYLREGAKAGLQLRPSQQQEQEEIPNFRYRALNTALIDWSEQATKNRDPHRVSIIIPVLNLPELTQACIESLYQYTDPARFELVVVDNGSDEPTALMLRQLAENHSNLRLVRNEENLNFALGSNLGFAASTGQQVIFLNNDTTVTANWLEPLLEPLSRPEISAVQPRLLYPDGTIQCMGIVFSDKSPLGYPIYAGMKPEESWAGRSRAFQAVTGACMALRAIDFAGVKGFDPVYINGQEDVDLCMQLKLKNKQQSWYLSVSSVYHHEGSAKERYKFVQTNRHVFSMRWRHLVVVDDIQEYKKDGFKVNHYYTDNHNCYQIWQPKLEKIQPGDSNVPQYDNSNENLLTTRFFQITDTSNYGETIPQKIFNMAKRLFDPIFYAAQQFTLTSSDPNLFQHFCTFGWRERLNPNALFLIEEYFKFNSDALLADINPLLHYIKSGEFAYRDIGGFFDTSYYLKQYPDIYNEDVSPLEHFVYTGLRSGFRPCQQIDPMAFLSPSEMNEEPWLLAALLIKRLRNTAYAIHALTAPIFKTPVISVIIYTHDCAISATCCITSLLRTQPTVPCEIIIADDKSHDLLPIFVNNWKNIRYVFNEKKDGIANTLNNAANYAKGSFLVFIDGHSEVSPGWDAEMLSIYDRDKKTLIVGGKILNITGTIQHAGGLAWCDANLIILGQDEDTGHPRFNYVRNVDFVSPSFLAIKTEEFLNIQGFETSFESPIYMAADLGRKAIQHGWNVIYHPFAQVTRYINEENWNDKIGDRQIFNNRWSNSLTFNSRNRASHFRSTVGHALVIDQITPTPDRDSGSVDQFNLISILQQLGWMVSFVPETNMEYRDVYTSNLQRIGVQCIYKPYYNNLYEFVRDEGDTVKLAILYKGPPTVHYLNIIIPHCQQARIIFNTVDIHYLREMREAELFNDSKKMANAMRTKKLEIEAIRRSDCTIILSPAEEQIIKSEIPDARLFVVPLIRNSPGRQARRSELKDVSFIGGFLHKPNCDAVHFFVANIWPLVHTKLPNVNFRIMGSNVPEDIKSLECESIVVDGFVSDLTTTFARCRVSVAPLRYGAGLKGKIASSLGFGIPCVATSVAAEGMVSGYINGIEVADEPKDFAEKIVRLYNDEAYWEKMSKHGVAFANSEYSIESTRDKFSMILNQLELPVDDFINNGGRHIFPDNQSTSRRNHLRNGRKSRSEVSVIVPLYNHEKYIAAALESVFTQTTPPTEVIVIDDGSTDQSADIAKRVCSGYKGAIFLSQSNIGAHNTINKAIQRSIQPIVAIINSDDIYNQNRLEKCLETINEQGKFIVATGIEFINEYNEFIENKWYTDAIENWKDIGNTSLALLNGNFIMTTSNLILHRRVFKDTGYFRDFRYAHDLDFFIRALGQGYKIEFISDALLKYRYHTSNTISENHTKVRAEWAYICAETFLNPKITILESLDFLNYTIKLSEILEKHRLAQGVFLIISVLKRYKYGMREFSEIISKPIISKALYNSLS